jgi:hypothetical protein
MEGNGGNREATSPYQEALNEQREAVAEWLETLDDVFKPPELKVGLSPRVFNAAVEVIAQYSLVKRGLG